VRRQTDQEIARCGKCHTALQPAPAASPMAASSSHEIRLQQSLQRALAAHSEIRLRSVRVPAGGTLQCLRCQHAWQQTSGRGLPARCPRCHSPRWSDFRLFRCQHCHQRFSSAALFTLPRTPLLLWPWPYWLFPACPYCRKRHWHRSCERHPLRALLNLMNGAALASGNGR